MVSVTFRKKSPSEIVELAGRAGLSGIEWGGDVHVPPGDTAKAREVAARTTDAGLYMPSYGSYFRVGEESPESFAQVVEAATILGVETIRVWAGRKGSAEASPAYREKVVKDSRRIAEQAADAGISISYEYHRNTLTDSLTSTLDLLDAVGDKRLYSYWQPPLDLERTERLEQLQVLLPRLSYVHVFHFDEDRKQQLLACGKDEWRDYFRLISQAGADRWALLEFVKDESDESLLADARTLRELVAGE